MKQINRGFTLIETLIVLAFLIILAALLFPVLGHIREKGRQATCQSNLKQIFLGVQQYTQDNDAKHPFFGNWRDATASYIKSPSVFTCPSIPEPIKRPDGGVDTGEYNFWPGFLNTLVNKQAGSNPRQALVGVNESVLIDSSKIFVSGDVGVYGLSRQISMPRQDACGMTMGNGRPDTLQIASTVHSGGGNYLFYDGHVKWMKPETFVQSLCDAAQYLQPPFRAGGEHVK